MVNRTSLTPTAAQLREIDRICNAFESAWKRGEIPRLEEFLEQAVEPLRPDLLRELAQLEAHYRPQAIPDLERRFPQLDPNWLEDTAGPAAGTEGEAASQDPPGSRSGTRVQSGTGAGGRIQAVTIADSTLGDREWESAEFPDRSREDQIPGYRITRELGRGGMGVVYEALDERLHRRVALKMIHPHGQWREEHRCRLMGEARAAARLRHPNLIQVFDAGEHLGRPYLVFELVEGGTLADRIRQSPVSAEQAAGWLETMARAVHYAHQRHVVHRDLKPANILICREGTLRISDFGLAKCLDTDLHRTASGMLLGTPAYMAPEQSLGGERAVTPAADVYSLGAILYELLAGQAPFKAASVVEVLEQLRRRDPVPPRSLNPQVPRDLEIICLKCLQKEPDRRYLSAELLAEDLARFRQGASIIARPVGPLERLGRWCWRHPAVAGLAAALLLALTAAFAGTSWQWREAVRQRRVADGVADMYRQERNRAIEATRVAEARLAEAREQRAEARRHQAAAESRFRKAEAPIQELIRLGTELTRQPGMEVRGRAALRKASEFRQALLSEKFDDPRQRRVTAATLRTLGWTLLEQGQFDEAASTYRQVFELFGVDPGNLTGDSGDSGEGDPGNLTVDPGNLTDDPGNLTDDPGALELLMRVSIELAATCARQSDRRAAERYGRLGVAYAERILAEAPDDPAAVDGLSTALANWAAHLASVGESGQAERVLRRGLENQRRALGQRPDEPGYLACQALLLDSLAQIRWATDREEAETLGREALEIRRRAHATARVPRDEAMYLLRSLLQLTSWRRIQGQLPEAEALVSEALRVARETTAAFPGFYGTREQLPTVLLLAGGLAAQQGDFSLAEQHIEEARREIEAAVRDFPDDMPLKRQLALWPLERGRLDVLRGQPAAGLRKMTESLRSLQELSATSSRAQDVHADAASVAVAAFTTGRRFEWEAEKIEVARLWAALAPETPLPHNVLAWRQVCTRDPQVFDPAAAEGAVRRALELEPENPDFLNTLGVTLLHLRRLEEALEAFQASQRLKPAAPASDWYHMAMVYHHLGDTRQALEYFRRARAWHHQHHPNDFELQLAQEQASGHLEPPAADAPPASPSGGP